MSAPEGTTRADVEAHLTNLGMVARLLNSASVYASADPGTQEEALAEDALSDLMDRTMLEDTETIGGVMLILATLVTQTSEEEKVQAWFDGQVLGARAALEGMPDVDAG